MALLCVAAGIFASTLDDAANDPAALTDPNISLQDSAKQVGWAAMQCMPTDACDCMHCFACPDNIQYSRTRAAPPSTTLAQIRELPRVGAPSAEFRYTDVAYQLLGAVAERVTQRSWHTLFEELVAGPCSMTATRFYNIYSEDPASPNPTLSVGAVSPPSDFRRFMEMLMHGGEAVQPDGTKVRVLSATAVDDMTSPHPYSDTSHCSTFSVVEGFGRFIELAGQLGLLHDTNAHAEAMADAYHGLGYGLGMWITTTRSTGRRNLIAFGEGGGRRMNWNGHNHAITD